MRGGFFLVDKKKGETSFDAVNRIRRDLRVLSDQSNEISLKGGDRKKLRVGHAGTLDPLATGLLLIAAGEAVKLLEFFTGLDKEYEVKARFGFVSDTFDAEGKVVQIDSSELKKFRELSEDEKKRKMESTVKEEFSGKIKQIPPKFSALKIGGKKAYELAREGKEFEMKARDAVVKDFEIVDFDWPVVSFRIFCGSGTYIRSLIHDLGQSLGTGAYVEELRRTKVGDYSVGESGNEIIPIEEMIAGFEILELSDEDFEGLKDGKILEGKKVPDNKPVMGLYRGEAVGVLENFSGGIKFAKVLLYGNF